LAWPLRILAAKQPPSCPRRSALQFKASCTPDSEFRNGL
jgi:hypothetical protein